MHRSFFSRSWRAVILCLVFILAFGMFAACNKTPPPDVEPDPPENEGSSGDSGTTKPKPPEEPYVPNTEPLIREEGRLYIYSSSTYTCNKEQQDKAFLYRSYGSTLDYCRYADGYNTIVYKFDIHTKCEPVIDFKIGNDYLIEISPDAKNWTKVYNWLDEHPTCRDRSNEAVFTIDPYEFEVYDICYIRFSDPSVNDGCGPCLTNLTFSYYEDSKLESLNIFDLNKNMYDILDDLSYSTEDPATVATYDIAPDGGLIYNPISREKAEELNKYDGVDCFTGSIEKVVNGVTYTLTYKIPKEVTAYDAMPIWYEITSSKSSGAVIYVNATAFEDKAREEDNLYYDLTLPGTVDVTWEYLGYVGGKDKLPNRAQVTAKFEKDKLGKQYPQYNVTDLIYSGKVQTNSLLWWKFRFTNTGNTVLDGDGNGTFCFEALLYRKEGGAWKQAGKLENNYNRIIDEVYPGESGEMYFIFQDAYNLKPGEYKIVINGLVRNETNNPENYFTKIWGGHTYTQSEFAFEITAGKNDDTPRDVVKTISASPTRNTWMHTYEEFMTSFDSHLSGITSKPITGTMYLQCAPWTNQVVLRMIVGNGDTMEAVSIPVKIETDSIKVNFNPDNNNYVVLENGTRFPAITAQSMADMRGNVQLGPDAAFNIIDNLLAMKDCGINLINTTAAFEFDGSFGTNRANNIDACWFSLDVARLLGLKLQGWITYPYESANSMNQANKLFGTNFSATGFGSADLAQANGMNAVWQYQRWGDNYWIGGDDTVVLDVEDTRGWMRVDFNARFRMTGSSKQYFRFFLMDMYGDIESLNEDWGTNFASFDEIDPEAGTKDDHGWASYKSEDIVFSEWSRPLELLDMFRTLERIQDYQRVLETAKEVLPTAKISLRTEGANWLATIDPTTENSHFRHVYYSQRRCGIIPELIAESGVMYAHSDYTTLPYTPSEVAELTASCIENGIVPMLLPQFNRMRDIAMNKKYGTDYTYEYNLDPKGATKGAYISTVCSVFEWFRATYENGGVPGILWQDYLCDGYATATQRKEIAFFTEKLTEALNTPEGQAWAKNFTQDTSVLDGSSACWTFDKEMVKQLIEDAKEKRN